MYRVRIEDTREDRAAIRSVSRWKEKEKEGRRINIVPLFINMKRERERKGGRIRGREIGLKRKRATSCERRARVLTRYSNLLDTVIRDEYRLGSRRCRKCLFLVVGRRVLND